MVTRLMALALEWHHLLQQQASGRTGALMSQKRKQLVQ